MAKIMLIELIITIYSNELLINFSIYHQKNLKCWETHNWNLSDSFPHARSDLRDEQILLFDD